jgi:peptidoglycan/xylan/chitin deacetylase (PgdA/CDA1 family)
MRVLKGRRNNDAPARVYWLALALLFAVSTQAREIAITFDDAPRGDGKRYTGPERTAALIESLSRGGVEGAIFFTTTRNLDQSGQARMLRYQQAGHFIGNHSHTHPHPHSVGLDAYVDDIRMADEQLRPMAGFVPLYRFPFLDEGRDVATRDGIRNALADLGYSNGYVTVDNYDFYMEFLYQRALEQGRNVNLEKLERAYVEILANSADFYDAIALQTLGRSPRHVLLLHENDLAAMFIDELAAELRLRGWTIISGPDAYQDPIADVVTDTLFNGQGRVAAIAATQGIPRRELVHEGEDEAWLETEFENRGVFGGDPDWTPFQSDLVFSSNASGRSQVYLRPAGSDERRQLTDAMEGANYPVWSPDGSSIAYQVSQNGRLDIWTMNADGSGQRQLTDHSDHDYLPSWTPDGKHITFVSWRREADDFERSNHHYIMAADGSEQRRLISETPGTSSGLVWLPDGERVILTRKTSKDGADLFLADAQTLSQAQLTQDGRYNGAPSIHPGGGLVAFYSHARGVSRLEIMGIDGSDRRVLLNDGLNWEPSWSPDGCWLVYTQSVTADHSNLEVWAMAVAHPDEATLLAAGPGRVTEAMWRPDPDIGLRCVE